MRLLALAVPLFLSVVGAAEAIQYGDVAHKVVRKADAQGDVFVSVKVAVTNPAKHEQEVSFSVHGLDAEGFEVTDVVFVDVVKAGKTKTFTDTTYVEQDALKTIVKWEVVEEPLARGLTGP